MATMFNMKINLSKIDKSKLVQGKAGVWGNITGVINDEVDDYGNNVSFWMEQSKEERDNKDSKVYLGNGKAFWTDGKVTIVNKENPNGTTNGHITTASVKKEAEAKETFSENLPF
jgi:hypothetical protein